MLKKRIPLSNDTPIPIIGLGTWQMPPGDVTYKAVKDALDVGYIHVDTAAGYQNEEAVGRAIKDSQIKREDLFVTTKLESHIKTYQGALDAFDASIKALDMPYVDLYLIHAPWPWSDIGSNHAKGNIEAWKALETIYASGKAKAIGISNFSPNDIKNILSEAKVIPHANQIGLFVGNPQHETVDYCTEKGIQIIAYSPLAIGYALTDSMVVKMASHYNVTPAQLLIRYTIERGAATLPKSTHAHRMIENATVDFQISSEDLALLSAYKNDPRKFN